TVRATANDALGTGPITVANATLRLENVTFSTTPNLSLSDGARLESTGTTRYTKSNFPAIANGTAITPPSVAWASMNASDNLSFGSAIRNIASGTSYATINVNPNGEAGTMVLNSGGVASSN